MEVRIRLGTGIARFAPAPLLTLELPGGATVADVYARLEQDNPEIGSALRSSVAIVSGAHVDRTRALTGGEEIALLAPISGGSEPRKASDGHRTS